MVVCVAPQNVDAALEQLKNSGESAFVIGEIAQATGEPYVNYL
jgi:phosphoribosylformylglycinamidine cyclo-ligase